MLSKLEEIRLVTKCVLTDDRDAFGRLVSEYQSEIRRFFINLTGGDEYLSDDLAQETFIKAYTSVRGFQLKARFKTWLYRIAYNEFYYHVRSLKQTEELEESVASIESSASATEAEIDVHQALKQLNHAERSCVILFFMEDKPIKEIAKIMNMPEGSVKSNLSRGKAKIAKFMS